LHSFAKKVVLKPIQSALISVFYKEGLDDLARQLHETGVEVISTGGTQKFIEDLGIPVTPVESLTQFPEVFGGRVKTLHPMIFGGILNRRDHSGDQAEKKQHQVRDIDMVVVDLYPFEETLEKTDDEVEIIEKIDIGGIALIRGAAKNFNDVLLVPSRAFYQEVIDYLKENNNQTDLDFRKTMAGHGFATSAHYDKLIAGYFGSNQNQALRYGENPHQKAWFEGDLSALFDQLHGKELSYNNLLDTDAAVQLMEEFRSETTFAILKHNNACGIASRPSVKEAYEAALAADPVSAFGGILITNQTVGIDAAEVIHDLFCEIVIAPAFTQEALDLLKKKKNRRLLIKKDAPQRTRMVRTILNGELVQEKDTSLVMPSEYQTVTQAQPTSAEMEDLHFADKIVKHTKSNAIVLVKDRQLLASGTGQTSRVDALRQAIAKAKNFGFDLKNAVMASDAFFPFPDCVEIAGAEGIGAILQPGGSVKDELSIEACNNLGIKMVMTGMRHFKH
jgi:phosphoribosylaminoimidazolecarboxamide formyltransferase/IMP cyclohydrolase